MQKLNIIGVGPGTSEYLTKQAFDLIVNSNEVFAFDRINELLIEINNKIQTINLSSLLAKIEESNSQEIAILLSGDINFYSATKYIQRNLTKKYEYNLVPGLTSYQLLCARINLSYEKMKLISLHGQNIKYLGQIMANEYTFLLCDQQNNINKILNDLKDYAHLKVYIGENLGMPNEKITIGFVDEIANEEFSLLSVIIIENTKAIDINETLYDCDFIRAKVPMTKQETRWLVISLLDLKSTDIVYDIGAGSGSLTVAMARRVADGHVYAVEKKEEAFNLCNENINKLHAYNTSTYFNSAIKVIEDLPAPDKVFIGGSGKDLPYIIEKIITKSKNITIVVTCITLETQNETMLQFKKHGIDFDVISINSARSKAIASYHMMYANNPITIIKGVFANES